MMGTHRFTIWIVAGERPLTDRFLLLIRGSFHMIIVPSLTTAPSIVLIMSILLQGNIIYESLVREKILVGWLEERLKKRGKGERRERQVAGYQH